MSCLPVPGLSLCHLLSSAGAFSVRLAVGRPGSPDIGAAVRFAVTFVAIRRRKSRPHPEPLAGRKTGNQSEPWLPPNGGLHQLQSLLLCACL